MSQTKHRCKEYTETSSSSEKALLVRACNGDDTAFETLVRLYYSAIFKFTYRCLRDREQAYDVSQHVFLQLYRYLPELSTNLSTMRTQSPLKAWLFRVAWNRCTDERRQKRPLLFCELETSTVEDEDTISPVSVILDPYPLPEEIAEQHDLQRALRQAIQNLPPKLRDVVFLRYTRELTFGEIGSILKMPENTVKTYFRRARPLLGAALTTYARARQ